MPSYNVQVKHGGKTHKLLLSTDAPPTAFKQTVYESTGVPMDRMKVMIKGGMLKVSILSRSTSTTAHMVDRMMAIGVKSHPRRFVLLKVAVGFPLNAP